MKDSKSYFIDTNIFIRIFIVENQRMYKDSFDFLNLIDRKELKCHVSDLVLSEVLWVLRSFYKISKTDSVKRVKSILDIKNITIINNSNMVEAVTLFEKHKVKFIDAIIATNKIFKESGTAIVSYDKDFDKLGIKRLEPSYFVK